MWPSAMPPSLISSWIVMPAPAILTLGPEHVPKPRMSLGLFVRFVRAREPLRPFSERLLSRKAFPRVDQVGFRGSLLRRRAACVGRPRLPSMLSSIADSSPHMPGTAADGAFPVSADRFFNFRFHCGDRPDRRVFVAEIDVTSLCFQRPHPDQDAFQKSVRITFHKITVLEGTGLSLVAIHGHRPDRGTL